MKELLCLFKLKHYGHCPWKVRAGGAWTEGRGGEAHRQFNCREVLKKNLCQVMKLLIAIHVSFCDSHVNRWTGCSAVFLEGVVHFKIRHCWRDTESVKIWRSICPCNFMGWFQGSCRTFRTAGAYGSKGHDIHPCRCPMKEQTLSLCLMQCPLLEAVYMFLYFKI